MRYVMVPNRNISYSRLVKDFIQVLLFDIGAKSCGLITTILVIRNLEISAYSAFTIFVSLSTMVQGVFGNGLSLSYVRHSVEKRSRGESCDGLFFKLELLLFVCFAIVALILAKLDVIFKVDINLLMLSLLYGLALSSINLSQSYFQALELYSSAGLFVTLKNFFILFYVLLLGYVFNSFFLDYILFGFIICASIAAIIGLILILNRGERLGGNNNAFYTLARESGWLMAYAFLINLLGQLDIVMLAALAGKTEVAQYGVAHRYYGLALSFLPAIQTVLRVKTSSKYVVDDILTQKNIARTWLKRSAPVSGLLTVVGVSVSWIVFPYLNGDQYNVSIPIFNILMLGVGLSYITAPNVGVMMASQQNTTLCLAATGAFIIGFFGNYLFIPEYGVYAAAISTVISQLILNGLCTFAIFHRKEGADKIQRHHVLRP